MPRFLPIPHLRNLVASHFVPNRSSPIPIVARHTMSTLGTSSSRSRSPTRIPGPVETAIHEKLTEALGPTLFRIQNDSSKHSHHVAMRAQGGGNGETHFSLTIVSSAFDSKSPIARHRLVNGLLKDEFDTKGLHALSLKCKTPAEWEREIEKLQL
ncbi:bola-like protein-domain-containing protein [Naematelia encephala]|uniref:Bola-like protein-domain-containing protein n=1 Tax=Naematelia encephala TaxID=71784 RepID=A0A1Y2AND7_9TREE|nr:bola-like protein-domain-containing protein [Naematelia encephala]